MLWKQSHQPHSVPMRSIRHRHVTALLWSGRQCWYDNCSGSSSVTHTNTGWMMYAWQSCGLLNAPHTVFSFALSQQVCSTSSNTFAKKKKKKSQNVWEYILISSCSKRLEHWSTFISSNGQVQFQAFSYFNWASMHCHQECNNFSSSLRQMQIFFSSFYLFFILLCRRQIQLVVQVQVV